MLNHKFIGNENADTIVIFLHQGLGSISQWRDFPTKVCAAINAYGYIYDRAGYGQSPGNLKDRTAAYLHEAADELSAVISNHIGASRKIILYGHSDGASIALIYAALYPDKIFKIVSEAAHVLVEQVTIDGVKAAQLDFEKGYFDGLEKYHGKRFKEVFYAWNDIWLSKEFKDWNIVDLLPNIKAKTLIIQGEDDIYGSLKQVELINANIPVETKTLIIPNCGHTPHKEFENDTLIGIKNFLSGT